ncbi:MAG TPA: hypothetical protein VNB64_05975 [Solirubrobacteraceae bacterium]|nr:hypothetical protein [Solirubrobacteraceae bacterium]
MKGLLRRIHPVRNVEIGDLLDTFLVSAVVMILVIRLQLWATNYPQLGGGKFHIAHLLWGGLFMLIALGILLSFLGASLRIPAAVIGGVGFGFFIDELGKFITSDNDYFYKPTAALIYVIFIALFLTSRAMQNRRGFTPREYLVNAIDITSEAARRDLDEREKRRALELLDKADQSDPMVPPLRALLRELDAIPPPEPLWPARQAVRLRDWYFGLIRRSRFLRFVGWVFGAWAVISLGQIVLLVTGPDDDFNFVHAAGVLSSSVAALLVFSGLWLLARRRRHAAYRRFDRALLASIFVTQVFAFAESQFTAVFGLGLDLLLLITVRAMIRGERELERSASSEGPAARGQGYGPPAPRPPAGVPARPRR